ncbi:hypothetical protein BGZ96_009169 [Linnemannia gamsii]|uniref:RNA-binding domain-containing protein n=1 Tax=Linnemannia gamsii TaxID=64522 RepID=A0ABQ7JXY3_9FUNG|nr:hypothetical protein BGZ96_009169 [Linnemannia gamsii]
MALFLGRLSADTRSRDLEDLFAKYGRVTRLDIKRGTNSGYGFVEYEDPRDADEAVHKLNGTVVNGNPIVVEFAKNNGRRAGDNECFKCGKEGHWARDCRGGGRDRERRRTLDMDIFRLEIFRQLFSFDMAAYDPDPMAQAEPGLVSRSPRRRSRSRSRSPRRDYDRDRYERRDYDRRDRSPRREYREDRREDRRDDRAGREEREEPHREERGARDEPRRGEEDRARSRSRSRSPRQD